MGNGLKINSLTKLERTVKVWNQKNKETPITLEKYTREYSEFLLEYNIIIRGIYGIQVKISHLREVELDEEETWKKLSSIVLEKLQLSGIENDIEKAKKIKQEERNS